MNRENHQWEVSDLRINDSRNNILLTIDVARMLHKSEACINKWRREGVIPGYAMPSKIHPNQRGWNWSKRAVHMWIEAMLPVEGVSDAG